MKKLFTILAVAASLVSCAKEEVVRRDLGEVIQFGNAFVDNATRATDPSYNATNLTSFTVYGAVENVNIYPGTVVSKGNADYGEAWTIDPDAPKQYWIAGANYIFDAVVDATEVVTDSATGLPTTLKYSTVGQKDMLHNRVTTVGKPTDNDGLVAFTFTHLLSKVKFTVENTTAEAATNYRYTVTDIAITGANLTGDYAVPAGTWGNLTTGNYSIADMTIASAATEECATEVLLIPGTNKVGMTFNVNVEMKKGDQWVTIETYPKSYAEVIALAANTAYNFSVSVGLDSDIQFTATEMPEWSNGNTADTDGDNVNDAIELE